MVGGLGGQDLLDGWRAFYREMAERWAEIDPRRRVPWVGPDMSARSSITARLMETWSHGQAVFDLFGLAREEHDRIRNVVVLGVNTWGWTWSVREREPPGPMPRLRLTAPSGAVWEYGEDDGANRIEGPAVAFAQVVAQTRNVADTSLRVTGPIAGGMDGERPVLRRPAGGPAPARRPPLLGRRRAPGARTARLSRGVTLRDRPPHGVPLRVRRVPRPRRSARPSSGPRRRDRRRRPAIRPNAAREGTGPQAASGESCGSSAQSASKARRTSRPSPCRSPAAVRSTAAKIRCLA